MTPLPKPGARKPRSAARLAAVQALYQMDIAGTDVNAVINEFIVHHFSKAEPAVPTAGADATFFAEILRGVLRRQREIDTMVDHQLATGWRLVRVDSTLRAILRAGVFELMERSDVPVRVVMNEYIDVAHAFFSEDEPKVVNGVLDKLAHRLRPSELPEKAPKGAEG